MRDELRQVLRKQGYGTVGEHVGVKLCHWTKEDLRHDRHCYKGDFYGIESRGCMQMTPIVDYCNFTCLYCWRSQSFDLDINSAGYKWDAPEAILDGALLEQRRLLTGYKGYDPEVFSTNGDGGGLAVRGLDYVTYPRSRTYTFGTHITF